jgi:hypothetical protein
MNAAMAKIMLVHAAAVEYVSARRDLTGAACEDWHAAYGRMRAAIDALVAAVDEAAEVTWNQC